MSTKSGNSYIQFGYDSKRTDSVTIEAGTSTNQVIITTSAGPYLASPQPQPSTFDPGLHNNVFQVNLPKGEVSVEWDIDGNTLGPVGKESGLPMCSTGSGGNG